MATREYTFLTGIETPVEPTATDPTQPEDVVNLGWLNTSHINLATDAHDASAISVASGGNLASVTVQAALVELQGDCDNNASAISNHLSDTTDAHDASAISVVASGNLSATDVQTALNELQSDIDTRALQSDFTNHTGDSSVHGVTGNVVGTSDTQSLSNKTFSDFVEIVEQASVTSPASGKQRIYPKNDGKWYTKNSGGAESELGGGGGGGGGSLLWNDDLADSPIKTTDSDQSVYQFEDGLVQYLTTLIKIPASYTAGSPIKMKCLAFSQSTSGTQLLKATSYLIRNNSDSFSSIANSHASTNSALTNSVANVVRLHDLDIGNGSGVFNGVSAAAGDLIRVVLTRDTATDTDTNPVNFLHSATEVTFT